MVSPAGVSPIQVTRLLPVSQDIAEEPIEARNRTPEGVEEADDKTEGRRIATGHNVILRLLLINNSHRVKMSPTAEMKRSPRTRTRE